MAEPINFYPRDSSTTPILYLKFDGSDGQTTTIDSSRYGHTVTSHGSVALDNAQSVLGTSCYFPSDGGTGASSGLHYWSIPAHAVFDFSTTDFKITTYVMWENDNNGESYFYYKNQNAFSYVAFFYDDPGQRLRFLHSNGTVAINAAWTAKTESVWYKIVLDKTGFDYKFYVDDIQVGTTVTNTRAVASLNSTGVVINDNGGGSPNRAFQGWMDEFLIEVPLPFPHNFYAQGTGSSPINFYSA